MHQPRAQEKKCMVSPGSQRVYYTYCALLSTFLLPVEPDVCNTIAVSSLRCGACFSAGSSTLASRSPARPSLSSNSPATW